MQRAFISYSRKDRGFVEQLHSALAQRDGEVWVDWKDIPLTAEFLTEILRGIEASENFLFIISPDSVGSRICQIELDHAGKLGKRLYPIIRRDVDAAVVPPQLAGVNWIFMREGDDFPTAVAGLIAALKTDLEWVRFHTLLTTRASEWQRANHERSRLLGGRSLREAKRQTARWAQMPPAISDLQSHFLRASLRASMRRRWFATVTALLLMMFAVLGVSLFRQQRAESRSRQAAITAGIESQRDPELGLLIAIEAMRLAPTDEAEAILRDSLREHHEIQRIALEELGLKVLVLSSDERWLAGGGEGRIYLWNAATLEPARPPIVAGSPKEHFDWCAFSADRRALAARCEDGTVFWWTIADWAVQRVPQMANQTFAQAVLSPDGRWLATRDHDRLLQLWEMAPDRGSVVQRDAAEMSHELVLSPDGRWLAAGFFDGNVGVWDLENGARLDLPTRHEGLVTALAFDPGSAHLVSGGEDGALVIWALEDATCERTIPLGAGPVRQLVAGTRSEAILALNEKGDLWSAAMDGADKELLILGKEGITDLQGSPDGRLIFHASGGALTFLDRRGGTWVRAEARGHESLLTSAEISAMGDTILTAGEGHNAQLWNIATGECLATLRGHRGYVAKALFLPGNRIASIAWDRTLRVWRVPETPVRFPNDTQRLAADAACERGLFSVEQTCQLRELATGHVLRTFAGRSLALSGDSRLAAIENPVGVIEVRECATGASRFTGPGSGRPVCTFSADGSRLVIAPAAAEPLTIWNTNNGQLLYRAAETAGGTTASLLCHESGLLLAAVEKEVLVFASDAPQLIRQLSGHGADVVALAWEPKRRLIASGEADQTVRVWDLDSGKCIARFRDHFRDVRALAFSPDGHWLATGGADFLIHVYETGGWQRTHTFRGHTADVEAFDFSLDSRFLASCGWDDTGRVWDIQSGRQVMVFAGPMWAVRFASDQRHLVAAGRSHFAHWRSCEEVAPAARLLEMASQRVRRPLTKEERKSYLPFLPEAVGRKDTH